LIVKLPGAAHGGRRVAAPVQHIDLPATVAALAGLPATGRGRSLVPLLDGSGPVAAAPLYAESLSPRLHFGWSELYAVSDDRYRYIRAPKDELYDLAADPRELTSVAEAQPQVRGALGAALDRFLAGAAPATPAAVSDEDRRKLAALGYVGLQAPAGGAAAGADPKDKIHVFQGYRQATELAAAQRFAEAAAVYQRLLAEDPGMTDVWLQLAEAFRRQGRHLDALAAYQQVIGRRPGDPASLLGASDALLKVGRVADARAHAELAVAAAPAIRRACSAPRTPC